MDKKVGKLLAMVGLVGAIGVCGVLIYRSIRGPASPTSQRQDRRRGQQARRRPRRAAQGKRKQPARARGRNVSSAAGIKERKIPHARVVKKKSRKTWETALKRRADAIAIRKDVHVALLTGISKKEPSRRILSALLTELSADDKIHLVERELIDKVLAEQRLSYAGLVNPKTRLKTGKLLSADVMVLFKQVQLPTVKISEKERVDLTTKLPEAKLLRAVDKPSPIYRISAVEGVTGVVLCSTIMAETTLGAEIQLVVNMVRNAVQKANAGAKGRHYISSAGFRVSKGGWRFKGLGSALEALVLNDLSQLPKVVVLERRGVSVLAREEALTGADLNMFPSALLFGVRLTPSKDKQELKLTVLLKTYRGGQRTKESFSADSTDVQRMRRGVLELIAKRLKMGAVKPVPLPSLVEADIFLEEARSSIRQGDFPAALSGVDAALSLDDSAEIRDKAEYILSEFVYYYGRRGKRKKGYDDLPWREELLPDVLKLGKRHFVLQSRSLAPGKPMPTHSFIRQCSNTCLRDVALRSAEGWPEWLELQRLHRDAAARILARYQAAKNKEKRLTYHSVASQIRYCKYWTEDPEEWQRLLDQQFAALASNPFEQGQDKDQAGTWEFELSLARAVRWFHRFDYWFRDWQGRFKEPGADLVEAKRLEWASKQQSPIIRLAASEALLRRMRGTSGARPYARQVLECFTKFFPIEHPVHALAQYVFPREGVEIALHAIRRDKEELQRYGQLILAPMLADDKLHVLVEWYWGFDYWIEGLAEHGEAPKAEKLNNQAIALLKARIGADNYPEHLDLRKLSPAARARYSTWWRAKRMVKGLKERQMKLAAITGSEIAREDPVPPRQWGIFEMRKLELDSLSFCGLREKRRLRAPSRQKTKIEIAGTRVVVYDGHRKPLASAALPPDIDTTEIRDGVRLGSLNWRKVSPTGKASYYLEAKGETVQLSFTGDPTQFPLRYYPDGSLVRGNRCLKGLGATTMLGDPCDDEVWLLRPKRGNRTSAGWCEATAGYLSKSNEAYQQLHSGLMATHKAFYDRRYKRRADLRAKNYQQALKYFNRAIKLKSSEVRFYLARSSAHYLMKNYAEAITDASKAIKLRPNLLDAYYNRSLARYGQRKYDKAARDMTKAKKIGPAGREIEEWLKRIKGAQNPGTPAGKTP